MLIGSSPRSLLEALDSFDSWNNKERDGRVVANGFDGAAVDHIADKFVAVSGHGDQVAMFGFGNFDDFHSRFAHGQFEFDADAASAQIDSGAIQIAAIAFHFVRFGKVQAFEIARSPTIGNVKEQEFGAKAPRQILDVRKQRFVRGSVFQSDQYFAIHGGLII
jgi:hypothetical protein